ncbi:MAG: hypothetical protein AseanaTS_03670 [Candidatus Pelagadaptatus aseana]|uniref:hypothetical protein n=1 Tax=Candidatus Pelagadaptatus aseana TaxID=3120508 RepID=UPI0039B15541
MTSLSEKINWYKQTEDRQWKRVWHCAELVFISLSAILVLVVLHLYGDGTQLQFIVALFTAMMALSSACLVPSFYGASVFQRWHMHLISLGLGCGVGVSAAAGFVILELQHLSS